MSDRRYLVKITEEKTYIVSSVTKKQGIWFCSQPRDCIDLPTNLTGKIHAAVQSSKNHIFTEEFHPLKKELLQLQMNKHLDQMALFDAGVKGVFCYFPIEQRQNKHLYLVSVLPEKDAEEALESITSVNRSVVQSIAASSSCLAAVLHLLSPEPFIAVLAYSSYSLIIGVRDGHALYLQRLQAGMLDDLDTGVLSNALNFCRISLQRDFGIESPKIICFGPARHQITSENLGHPLYTPPLPAALQSDHSDFLTYPDLFGALFVQPEHNFLPDEYKKSIVIRKATTALTCVIFIASAILSSLWWNTRTSNQLIESQLLAKQQQLNQHIAQIQAELPNEETIQSQETYAQLIHSLAQEPQLHTVLANIVAALPEDIQIVILFLDKSATVSDQEKSNTPVDSSPRSAPSSIPPPQKNLETVIAPVASGAEGTTLSTTGNTVKNPEEDLQKTMSIKLVLSTKGSSEISQSRFETTILNFSKKFSLSNIRWGFNESSESGYLAFEARIQGKL